jgi:hypothetical protein
MKTVKSLTIGLCLLVVHVCFAQSLIDFGGKAGLNLATQAADDGVSTLSYKPGLSAGFYIRYTKITTALQMELLFSQQGSVISYQNEKYRANFNYVILPLLYRVSLKNNWNIQAGTQAGFLMCAKSDFHPVIHAPFAEQTYTKAYRKADVGLVLGGGWTWQQKISVDIRYYFGLTGIDKYEGVVQTKNRMFQLSVSYPIVKGI